MKYLTAYLITILISYPLILKWTKKHHEQGDIVSPEFMAKIISFLPGLNLWYMWKSFVGWVKLKICIYKLRKAFKDHPDEEVRNSVNKIADGMEELNN